MSPVRRLIRPWFITTVLCLVYVGIVILSNKGNPISLVTLGTGILFARFSRPTAAIIFSQRAVVAPYHGKTGLMFRLTNKRMNQLIELEAKVLFSRVRAGARIYDQLSLERTRVVFFPLSWTIVHPINEKSPLYNFNYTDMVNAKIEALVFVKAFDEVFSNTVVQRFSYIASEVVWGAKFKMMYHADQKKGATVLDLNKLNDHEKVELLSPVITPQ